ncbi:MAG: DUF4169 family protein [Paracoccaceae bacterium]
MSTPVNLNKIRKSKARADKRTKADANAISFGRTKSEKDAARDLKLRAVKQLDGKKLDKPGSS